MQLDDTALLLTVKFYGLAFSAVYTKSQLSGIQLKLALELELADKITN